VTVEELIDELRAFPQTAIVVLRVCTASVSIGDDIDEPIEATIDEVLYTHGEVIISAD
jgi:hypothetical protein